MFHLSVMGRVWGRPKGNNKNFHEYNTLSGETDCPWRTLFGTVAEQIFDRYRRRSKPRTMEVNRV